MSFHWIQIPWSLLTLLIVVNYGLLMTALIRKIGARVGRRQGIPIYQNYIDLIKNYALRSSITHGVMFYLGPVFRLSGGVGLLLFVPTIYRSEMFANFSFAGDLILALYFVFFGTLGMALGAGESGSPHSAIGISRGLAQVTTSELPFALAVFAVALQYQSLSVTEIVAAQQGSILNWTLFTNPFAVAAAMLAFLGSMMRPPFDVVLAPQEIPIGPPTEYHSAYLALMQTNRVIFPVAKIVIYMNLFFGVLGMALGAGESGSPHSAIGISRGLAQVTTSELPLALAVFAVALQYQSLSVTEIVAAQQGSILNWTLFTNPFAVAAAMLAFLGSMMRPPFDVVLAPQEIPIGPPTEYHSAYLALMQTNRVIFPVAKIVIYMNLFFGGAASWSVFFVKVFLMYLFSAFVGVVFPRFRVEQSIRWFLIWAVPLGIIAILVV